VIAYLSRLFSLGFERALHVASPLAQSGRLPSGAFAPSARRRLASSVKRHLGESCEAAHSLRGVVHPVGAFVANGVSGLGARAARLAAVAAIASRGAVH
jgi:hypothetical protein